MLQEPADQSLRIARDLGPKHLGPSTPLLEGGDLPGIHTWDDDLILHHDADVIERLLIRKVQLELDGFSYA